MLPHVLFANERIRAERRRLLRIREEVSQEQTLRPRDRRWLLEIAKTYRGLAKDAEEELEKQVYAYNYYQAKPRQVAGTDVRVAPVTGEREGIV